MSLLPCPKSSLLPRALDMKNVVSGTKLENQNFTGCRSQTIHILAAPVGIEIPEGYSSTNYGNLCVFNRMLVELGAKLIPTVNPLVYLLLQVVLHIRVELATRVEGLLTDDVSLDFIEEQGVVHLCLFGLEVGFEKLSLLIIFLDRNQTRLLIVVHFFQVHFDDLGLAFDHNDHFFAWVTFLDD